MPALPQNEFGYLCHRCVEDEFLAADIKNEGSRHLCMQCGKLRKDVPFSELPEMIHGAIEGNFRPGRDDEGQSFAELVAEQVQSWFSGSRGYSLVRGGEVNIY